MALTDIVAPPSDPAVMDEARGNTGVLTDIVAQAQVVEEVPQRSVYTGNTNVSV